MGSWPSFAYAYFGASFDVTLPSSATVTGVTVNETWTDGSQRCNRSEGLYTPSGQTSVPPDPSQFPWFKLTGGQTITYLNYVWRGEDGPSSCSGTMANDISLAITYTTPPPTGSISTSGLTRNPGFKPDRTSLHKCDG
jgi:hypothetical protein